MQYFLGSYHLTDGFIEVLRSKFSGLYMLVLLRYQVLKALDIAREDKVIGASLEAAVFLEAGGEMYDLLTEYLAELPAWFVTSQVELRRAPGPLVEVRVDRARGDKCERCWKYKDDVGTDQDFPTSCASCAAVVPQYLS